MDLDISPDAIPHKPRPIVDREFERKVFVAALESPPQQAKSILLVEDSSGQGKTKLLRLYEKHCRDHNVPVAYVDLRIPRDPMEILRFILDALKEKYDIRAGANDVRGLSLDEQKQWWATSTRAFLDDLMELAYFIQFKRFVLLFDTFEEAGHETKSWILDHILQMALPSRVSCLVIVLAGRKVPDPTGEWAPYCNPIPLQRLRLEAWLEYAERVNPSLERVKIVQLYKEHGDNPLMMANSIEILDRQGVA